MPDYDAADLATSVKALEDTLKKTEVPVEPIKEAHGLLSKALDAIIRLAPRGKKDVVAKSEDDPPMEDEKDDDDDTDKAMTMEEDRDQDMDIAEALMELFGEHFADHDEGDKAMASADLGKSVRRNGGAVVVLHDYFNKSLKEQDTQGGRLKALEEKLTPISKAMTLLAEELQAAKVERELQSEAIAALTKSMMVLLEAPKPDAVEEPVQESQYEKMTKALRPLLGENGGTVVKYNKDQAADMVLKGQMTPTQQRAWKLTGRMPDGVRLAS